MLGRVPDLGAALCLAMLAGCAARDPQPQPQPGGDPSVGREESSRSEEGPEGRTPAQAGASAGSGERPAAGVDVEGLGDETGNEADFGPAAASPGSGVCGFSAPVAYGEPDADDMVEVPPSDPNIFYMGRMDCRSDGPTFAFPAVGFRVRIDGSALDLRLRDSGNATSQSTNYYDVRIDGAEPTLLEAMPGDHVYPLARDLGAGEHVVEVVKRVESNGRSGTGQLLGLRVRSGTSLLPITPKPLRLEFVGDSITCGYGNEVSTMTPDQFPYTTRNSNANLAYGAVVARQLDAEYVAVAASGRGVYRNYADSSGDVMPVVYDRALPDDPAAPAWDFARYTPDVVVINLGTNDFSPPGPDHELFRAAYASFLDEIRGHYPSALLLAVVGPMLSDGFPAGVMAWTTVQSDVSAVVADRNAAGDDRAHYLALTPQSAPYGEDWHPTVATHESMAGAVAAEIERLLAAP